MRKILLRVIVLISLISLSLGAPPNHPNQTKRISQIKCKEYMEKIFPKNCGGGGLGLPSKKAKSSKPCPLEFGCNNSAGLIVGGEKAKEGEFPHMAAIGFTGQDGKKAFKCGGTLISEDFVLTAAHCLEIDGKKPDVIRVGSLNLNKTDVGQPEDIRISERIEHPDYRKGKIAHDIALIRLNKSVSFDKKYVRPACLQQDLLPDVANVSVIATGWGATKTRGLTSDDLMKVSLLYRSDKDECFDTGMITDYQICVGGIENGKEKDTCNGDSGGPIQISNEAASCVYNVVGVTTKGSTQCGRKPGIYSSVVHYLDWIEDTVWPEMANDA